jgi:hypothetical protein
MGDIEEQNKQLHVVTLRRQGHEEDRAARLPRNLIIPHGLTLRQHQVAIERD